MLARVQDTPRSVALTPTLLAAFTLAGAPEAEPPPRPVRRNNTVLVRDSRRPVWSVGAHVRLAGLLGSGRDVIQPFGFGFALDVGAHFVAIARARFGFSFIGGHTRFHEVDTFNRLDEGEEDPTEVERARILHHTDLGAGPSLQVPIGPLFLGVAATGGATFSTLVRPQSDDPRDDDRVDGVGGHVRGRVHVGIPIRNNHGIVLGVSAHKIFGGATVVPDPDSAPDEQERFSPFDFVLDGYVGYQAWF